MSSSEEEVEVESTITETQEEETAPTQRESSDVPGPSRPLRKRKRSDRTASSSLSAAETHRKTRKVAIVYSTDETDDARSFRVYFQIRADEGDEHSTPSPPRRFEEPCKSADRS